jgi:hypothetical protein
MKQNLLKTLTVLLFVLTGFTLKAQDIIVKTDKTEIKAKILEIEENTIKYKKSEFIDGPSYNINKSQVFMIIYKNGTRETFEASKPVVAAAKPVEAKEVVNLFSKTKAEAETVAAASTPAVSEEITADTRVDYFPSRLWGSFSSLGGLYVSAEREFGLLPNYVNSGLASNFSVYESEYASSFGYGIGIFASGYLPVNRLTGNTENQNKGFFPFVRVGAAFNMVDTEVDGQTASSSAFGFSSGVGADYKFSPKFGLSVMLSQFNSFGYGITFNF